MTGCAQTGYLGRKDDKMNKKILEKTWTFEKIEGNPNVSKIVAVLILIISCILLLFNILNTKQIDSASIILLISAILLWLFPDKQIHQKVVLGPNGIEINFGRLKGKSKTTYFHWNRLTDVTKQFDKNGFPHWITFKGYDKSNASILANSFKKDLTVLLKQYSTYHGFSITGFERNETEFNEFDSTIPEYKSIIDLIEN
jgi:hypothetical protein